MRTAEHCSGGCFWIYPIYPFSQYTYKVLIKNQKWDRQIQNIIIYLIWSFLQKLLTAFAKSSLLEIYLTGSPKFASDWEIHFMNIKRVILNRAPTHSHPLPPTPIHSHPLPPTPTHLQPTKFNSHLFYVEILLYLVVFNFFKRRQTVCMINL